MDRKNNNKLWFILYFVLLCLLFVPTYTTHAYFSDTVSEDVGIKLSLGNIDLEFSDSNQDVTEEFVVKNKTDINRYLPEIKNNGSLDGKLFYKVEVSQTKDGNENTNLHDIFENNSDNKFKLIIHDAEGQQLKDIEPEDVGKLHSMTNDSSEFFLSSGEKKNPNLSFTFSSNKMSSVNNFKIQISIVMMQRNGEPAKPMFHDEVTMTYIVHSDKNNSNTALEYSAEPSLQTGENINSIQLNENNQDIDNYSDPQANKKADLKTEVSTDVTSSSEPEKELAQKKSEETSPVANIDSPQKPIDESSELPEISEASELLLDEEFNYIPLQLNDQSFEIGITQEQFDWITQFETMEEFAAQITEETPLLYIKYDKVTGIEDIEQYVYELAEKEQLGFEIDLRTIPEEKLLEITFTK